MEALEVNKSGVLFPMNNGYGIVSRVNNPIAPDISLKTITFIKGCRLFFTFQPPLTPPMQ